MGYEFILWLTQFTLTQRLACEINKGRPGAEIENAQTLFSVVKSIRSATVLDAIRCLKEECTPELFLALEDIHDPEFIDSLDEEQQLLIGISQSVLPDDYDFEAIMKASFDTCEDDAKTQIEIYGQMENYLFDKGDPLFELGKVFQIPWASIYSIKQ